MRAGLSARMPQSYHLLRGHENNEDFFQTTLHALRKFDDTKYPAKGDTREARMYSRNLMNISTRIRVVNSTLENSVAVRKLRVPHPSRALCGRVGNGNAGTKRIKISRAEKRDRNRFF